MPEISPPPRWPLWLAAAATLLWLLVTLAALSPLIPGLVLPRGFEVVAVAAGITLSLAAPLALLWFLALRLQDSSRSRADRAALMAEQTRLATLQLTQGADAISQLEYRLSDLTGQLTAMAKPVERQHIALAATITGLQAAAADLLNAVDRTETATATLGQETPAATDRANQLTETLDASRAALTTQIADAEALLTRLAARLAEARAEANTTAGDAETSINAITAATTAAHTALAEPLAALSSGVDAALARTNDAVATTRQGVDDQATILASAVNVALAATHAGLATQTGNFTAAVEAALAQSAQALVTAQDDIEAQTATVNAAVEAALDQTGRALATTREALDAQALALTQTVDASLARTADALAHTRDGIHAQTNAMLASVDQARTTIDHIGGESAKAIAAHLSELTTTLAGLGFSLDTQADRAAALVGTLESQIKHFDASLAASAEQGDRTLASVDDRLGRVQASLHGLTAPVADTDAGLTALVARLATLDSAAGHFFEQLSETVPATLPKLDDLQTRLIRLQEEAATLPTPFEASIDSLVTAQSRLESAGTALEAATDALQERLASAEAALTAITRHAGDEALAATATLLDSFGRIRDVAAQSAGTMRDTLAGVVAEAEAALDRAGTAKAEAAFGAPVRTALAALETQQNRAADAAQGAAERVTNRLMALTQTVTRVETHFDKRLTEIDIRERSDLARRATELLANLHDQSIDLTRLLAINIEDQAYEDWLAGDRSRFLRALSQGLNGETGRAINRHLAHDTAFRVDAARFAQDFENLITHVTADRQGRALAATLLASDPGKLYLALTQADPSEA